MFENCSFRCMGCEYKDKKIKRIKRKIRKLIKELKIEHDLSCDIDSEPDGCVCGYKKVNSLLKDLNSMQ